MFSLIEVLGKAAPLIHIVDAGAAWMGEKGDQSRAPYRELLKPGLAKVIGFEPVKEECDKLNALGFTDQRYLPYFIGDGSRREFRLCNKPKTSSLYEPNQRLLSKFNNLAELTIPVERSLVQTTRLDDIPEIEAIDFLKLDIQGAELDALRGGERQLKRTVVIHTEVEFVPMYEGQPLFAEVDQELRRQGFLLHAIPVMMGRAFKPVIVQNNVNKGVNQVLWADVVYVKDFTRFQELDAQQLLRLAVIAHEVYKSCDLAAFCLRHYEVKAGTKLWADYMQRLTGVPAPTPPPID